MVEPGQLQMFNKDDAHDIAFTLPPGVTKYVEYTPDMKMENAGTYIMWLEDHTMGNALRMQLLRNPNVLFAGYRVEHPLIPNIEIKIQTTENSSPAEALKQAYQEIIAETKDILGQFQQQMRDRGVPGFPDTAEIADAPEEDDDDEATSHRFSEMSGTEIADDDPRDMDFPQLQDEIKWKEGYKELEQKMQSYAEAANDPLPFHDPLCVEDIDSSALHGALDEDVVMESPVSREHDILSAGSEGHRIFSAGSSVRTHSLVDSGDMVRPATEGETPVLSEEMIMSAQVATPSADSVISSSSGFASFINPSVVASSVGFGDSVEIAHATDSSAYEPIEFDEPTSIDPSSELINIESLSSSAVVTSTLGTDSDMSIFASAINPNPNHEQRDQ